MDPTCMGVHPGQVVACTQQRAPAFLAPEDLFQALGLVNSMFCQNEQISPVSYIKVRMVRKSESRFIYRFIYEVYLFMRFIYRGCWFGLGFRLTEAQ